jgi:hypothetical protein
LAEKIWKKILKISKIGLNKSTIFSTTKKKPIVNITFTMG